MDPTMKTRSSRLWIAACRRNRLERHHGFSLRLIYVTKAYMRALRWEARNITD